MHIVIIGNGIAGITTARHIRKQSDHQITVISGESDYFYSRPALMYIYMGHMEQSHTEPYERSFWEKNRIQLKRAWVSKVEPQAKLITFKDGSSMDYDTLVLATGSQSNFFNWPGQDLKGVQGLVNLQDLAQMEANTKDVKQAVIVGGGLIGIEMAEMLRTRHIAVRFLVRETHYWGNILRREEGLLVGRHMAEHHVQLDTETQLKEIVGDEQGRVKAVITDKGEAIPCQFVGITAGVHPNIDLAKASQLETKRGILVNQFLETKDPHIYAVGDCAEITDEQGNHRVEQLWYTGRMQGEALAKTICGARTAYNRGVWFNSAKFFDIEYHTYGQLLAQVPDWERSFYREHANGKQCIRLVYRADDQVLTGMNAFGIRYRHQVFERWLQEKRTLGYVFEHLEEANFDPEFFRRFEEQMVHQYNRMDPNQPPIKLRKKRRWFLGVGA
ncbi:MAG: NAD(P)/FAD-dependent oxidoreductase [Acidobacteria bacterium]|nr:NAD(P)/FAD-dependent oxidoreductase [Acidobacteriota bacterium]